MYFQIFTLFLLNSVLGVCMPVYSVLHFSYAFISPELSTLLSLFGLVTAGINHFYFI